MRKLFSIAILSVLLMGSALTVHSQAKLGHIDTNQLLRQMPGREAAQQELERYARELESQFTAMQGEFETKYQDYLSNAETFSDLIRQSRERELQSLQERIMEFQESAQEDLMKKENNLLSPIIEEARIAIDAVAKEKGYNYVFDTSMGSVLYAEPSDNLMDAVKKKLGI